MDCSTYLGSNGCNGSKMSYAYKYAMAYPIELETDYPYITASGTCAYSSALGLVSLTSYAFVTANSPSALETAVATGPVASAIYADETIFKSYSSGIISSATCGTSVNHGVLITGYGTDSLLGDYWTVRNSWGSSWGESGYFRIARSSETGPGICGILKQPSYPKI